jgi:hypothetical protein
LRCNARNNRKGNALSQLFHPNLGENHYYHH